MLNYLFLIPYQIKIWLENLIIFYKLFFVKKRLMTFIQNENIDDTHGYQHALCVLNNSIKTVNSMNYILTLEEKLSVYYASLLHDVDDSKYFSDENYDNCIQILEDCKVDQDLISKVVFMISLVSCSKNGNNIGDYQLWKLIPRWSDRLEAIGEVGVKRCYDYTKVKGDPLYNINTPRPQNEEEIYKYATPERFQKYIDSGGKNSETMIDHYYDKLIQIASPPIDLISFSEYLVDQFEVRRKPIIDICLYYGRFGSFPEIY